MTKNTPYFLFEKDFSPHAIQQDFSKEELDCAKKQAYVEGYEEGCRKAHADMRAILSKLEKHMQDALFLREQAFSYAVTIATAACDTLFPKYSTLGALDEVKSVLMIAFEKMNTESAYRVTCAPALREEVEGALKNYEKSFNIRVEGNEAFVGSDLEIHWDNGLIWRNEAEILSKINQLLISYKDT